MPEPFHILDDEIPDDMPFDVAVRGAVASLEAASARFDALYQSIPEERYSEDEWRVVEKAARDVEEAVERLEESYVAVQYDSHAWYSIMENLTKVRLRLESAIGVMERVKAA
jgi:hypothetical protein